MNGPSQEDRHADELRNWAELSRRVARHVSDAQTPSSPGNEPYLIELTVPASDPHGLVEMMDAMRASAVQRWNDLTKRFAVRHYYEAEAPPLGDPSKWMAAQRELDQRVKTVARWLRNNLKEGTDFEIESSGVCADFNIFFKSEALYARFCQETGESPQEQKQ